MSTNVSGNRCSRCGRIVALSDKFCAECGLFLRDAAVDQRLLLALTAQQQGNSDEARHELERLLDNEPEHALANHLLGTFYFHDGLMDQAIECYRHATDAAPQFILAYYDLGVAYYHRGDMRKAVRSFQRCLELNADYNAAHYRLALALYHTGNLQQALEHFHLSMALTPEYVMAHYHMGVVQERLGQLSEAAGEFNKAQEEMIGDQSSLWHLANVHHAQGNDGLAQHLRERLKAHIAIGK
jgi:tetratricopeptide (TPR) repeat protein